MRGKILAALALPAAVLTLAAAGSAALPGGTSFEVHVTAPSSGAVLPEATPILVTGQATVGAATPIANSLLITAIDVSGSTANPVSTGACGNQNPTHDLVANTVMDCELAAAKALNAAAVSAGTVAQVGLIGFAGRIAGTSLPLTNEAAPLDLSPAVSGQTLVAPAADLTGNGIRDVEDAIASAYNGNIFGTHGQPAGDFGVGFTSFSTFTSPGNTNYWAAVTQIRALAATPSVAGLTKIAVMLSDGDSTVGSPSNQPVSNALIGIAATGLKIYTFAIGNLASCAGSGGGFGTLQEIANASGATCTHIANPGDAVAAVPAAIGSSIDFYRTSANGSAGPFDVATGTPVPPASFFTGTDTLRGPGAVDISNTYPASVATPGPKTLCVRATGADGGGSQTLTDCVDVTIKARPTVTLDGGYGQDGTVGSTPEGTAFSIGATVNGTGTTTWTSGGGTGTCTFGDEHAVNTTVTCTDDGTYALTLTVDDAVNAPFSATEHLLVTNVDPVPTLTLTPTLVPLSSGEVAADIAIADPGSDTFTCVVEWGDGGIDTLPATGTSCHATHQYLTAGTRTVQVTVTDDDTGTGSTSGDVTVKGAPTLTLRGDDPLTGRIGEVNEGTAFAIPASVGGATSVSWTASGGTGTCTFTPSDAASTSVTCNDNGLYALTLSAEDAFGQTSSATVHLLVDNVAPTLTVSNPVAGASPRSVTFNGIVTDPGLNDVLSCLIDWGDTNIETVPVSGGFCNATHTYDASLAAATIHVTASDDDGGVSAERIIPLTFNRAPVCTAVRASDGSLWPPNHQMELIQLSGATDPDAGDSVSYAIVSVRQDEPLLGGGSGNFSPDARLASGGAVYLRSERDGTGDGRVYTIAYRVSDTNGASCTGTVTVTVAHDQAHGAILTPGISVNSLG